MSDRSVIYVAFDGERIGVRSDLPEVQRRVRNIFGTMVASPSDRTIADFSVTVDGDGGYLLHDGCGSRNCTSIEEVSTGLMRNAIRTWAERRSDLMWFHAGGVVQEDRAVMFPGTWGAGKSTVTTAFCGRGWSYLSDDMVPWDPATDSVLPFPVTPAVREDPGRSIPRAEVAELKKQMYLMAPSQVYNSTATVQAVIFPEFRRGGPVGIDSISPGQSVLKLLEACMNFQSHRSAAINSVSRLVERIPTLVLYHTGNVSASMLESILDEVNLRLSV